MLVQEELPSSHSHFRLVWRVTAAGEENANTNPLPSVIKTRWLLVVARSGSGTLTLKGGERLPDTTVAWDTVLSLSVTGGASQVSDITSTYPYEFYKVEFVKNNPADNTPIDIFVVLKGDL